MVPGAAGAAKQRDGHGRAGGGRAEGDGGGLPERLPQVYTGEHDNLR